MNSTRTSEDARIAAELVALGEPGTLATDRVDDPDVGVVMALFGLAHGAGPELTPLERRRVWRRLEATRSHVDAPVQRGGGGLWIGLAAAAALLLVPLFAPKAVQRTSDPQSQATLIAMGQSARRSLADMPGGQDQTRARAMADDYAARLHGTAGAPNGGE